VVGLGTEVRDLALGDRVGIAWLRQTCGTCRWCRRGAENLCLASRYTGWDEDGGYAEYAVVPAAYAYRLPSEVPDLQLAPLLCAGIIGYRALRRAKVPPGGRLGIYGFGASAHLTAQVALAQGAEVHVLTRDPAARRLALELGATSAGAADDEPPVRLDSAIVFAPAGELVPVALAALDQGGTLAVAGIHLSDIPGWTTSGTCSGSGRSPASPRTPAPTERTCWRWPAASGCARRSRRTRSSMRRRPSTTCRRTGSPGPRC
jgi:propanol-preferring alcohol dehydrogenase